MLAFLGAFSAITAGCGIAEGLGVPAVDDSIAEGVGLPVAAVDEGGRVLGFGPPETRFEGNLTKTAVGSFDSVMLDSNTLPECRWTAPSAKDYV
jgi:hypothetical protein